MEYHLIRARRKTLTLTVRPDGTVEVRAPLKLSRIIIDGFLEEKAAWIEKQQALRREQLLERSRFRLEPGAVLPFLDRNLTLKTGGGPALEGDILLLPGDDLRKETEAFYRREAHRILPEKAAFWGQKMGLSPAGITITGARTRWGSCSAKGRLSFSWRLLRAPEAAVDYVVVHELAHLRQMNHSRRFWEVVAAVFPDWKARRALLLPVQRRLEAESWNDPPPSGEA